nr:hypothetical protein [Abalone asfa-like virus]
MAQTTIILHYAIDSSDFPPSDVEDFLKCGDELVGHFHKDKVEKHYVDILLLYEHLYKIKAGRAQIYTNNDNSYSVYAEVNDRLQYFDPDEDILSGENKMFQTQCQCFIGRYTDNDKAQAAMHNFNCIYANTQVDNQQLIFKPTKE